MARSRIIAGKAVIIIEAQDLVNKSLGKIRNNLHRFSNEVGKIGEGLFRTGFFGALGSGLVVNSFVKFDDALRTLRVNLDLFGKSAQQVDSVMKPLEERIRSLAKTTPFSPTEVAGAATELAKGGFNPKQIIDSLQAVLDLSRATNTELGQSSEFVVRTLSTYGIATENAAEVVSQLVRAARKGTLGIEDLEAALRYSSGTADNLGISLQKMLAIFTVLSNKGLVGSLAGTSTNAAISNLVKKAQELKDIGAIDIVTGIRQDGREALDLIKTLENLFRYAETLPFIKQQTLFQDVFNLRGARSVAAIRKELEQIKGLTGFISDAGDEAAQAAKIMDEGIGGSLRRLFSTLQDLGVALGQTVEQPIIRISAVLKGLLTELGRIAALNPAITSLVILSPGILLAAGAGMIALAKGLRLAAYAAGTLKSALGPIGRLLSKGTVGQITALSQLRKSKVPDPRKAAAVAIRTQKANLAALRTQTAVSSVVAAKQAKQITTAQRALTRARNRARKLPKSTRTPFFGFQSTAEQTANIAHARQAAIRSIDNTYNNNLARQVAEREARFAKTVGKIKNAKNAGSGASDLARSSLLSQRAKAAARSARLSIGATKAANFAELTATLARTGIQATNVGKAFVGFGKGLLTALNITRRFVFSTTGLLTILEVILLFGDKIPIVKNALAGLGKGFGDAFKQIGNIAKFASGPLALFRASIQAFQADKSKLGVEGLKQSFFALTSIIGNQLVAAWNKFKEAIAPVYDFIVGLFNVIDLTIKSIVESISQIIGSAINNVSNIGSLFSGGATNGIGNSFLQGITSAAEAFAKFVPTLFNWLAQFSIVFNDATQKFIFDFEYMLNSINPVADQKNTDRLHETQLENLELKSNSRKKALKENLEVTLSGITKAFTTSSAETSRTNANKAISNSLQKSRESFAQAANIMRQLQRTPAPLAPKLNPQAFQQQITPQNNPLNVASIQSMKLIAEALVGSVQSTSRNLLRAGKPIEQKQLEEQEKTNEILEKIAKERGIQFAP